MYQISDELFNISLTMHGLSSICCLQAEHLRAQLAVLAAALQLSIFA